MLRMPSLGELDQELRVRVYLCTSRTDMRKGFDTLAVLVQDSLGYGPMSGHLFLFVGRRRDRLKIFYWDRYGYALWHKRLEKGTFRMPVAKPDTTSIELRASELAMLLEGIDLRSIRRRKRFQRPA